MKITEQVTETPAYTVPAKVEKKTVYLCEICGARFEKKWDCQEHESQHTAKPTEQEWIGSHHFCKFPHIFALINQDRSCKSRLPAGSKFDPNAFYCFQYGEETDYNGGTTEFYTAYTIQGQLAREEESLEEAKTRIETLSESIAAIKDFLNPGAAQ